MCARLCIFIEQLPVNTRRRVNVVSVLAQRLRRLASTETALVRRVVFVE